MKKAAILAAGDSTRMLALSANLPKHLLPLAGKPLIFHTLGALGNAGIEEVLIICGYHNEILREGIGSLDWKPMTITYRVQEERKGTAHAAALAEDFAGNDDILLLYGDILTSPSTFDALIEHANSTQYRMLMAVKAVQKPDEYGVVIERDGRAVKLVEKPRPEEAVSNLVNAGIFAVGPELWEAISKTEVSPRGEYEITDSISMLIDKSFVGTHELKSWWVDVGKPWDLLQANEMLLKETKKQIEGTVEEGAVIKDSVVVEKGAIIRSGAYIQGPTYISQDAVVGPNCYIRPHTYLAERVKVGNAVEIKNSIIMEGTSIGHLSYVGDSVIGRNVNFGAGTITANLRHDNQSINVTVKGKRVNSGRRKLGAIIGDDVKTGIGTSLAPGVVLYQRSRTGIGVIVDRDIEEGKMLIADQHKKTISYEKGR